MFIIVPARFPFLDPHNGIREGEEMLWPFVYILLYVTYIIVGLTFMCVLISHFMKKDKGIVIMCIIQGTISLFFGIPYACWLAAQCVVPPLTLLINGFLPQSKRAETATLLKWNLRLSPLTIIFAAPLIFYIIIRIVEFAS